MQTTDGEAFEIYLRTGRRVKTRAVDAAIETKFNPYHDPQDGRFTFGPGGSAAAPYRTTSRAPKSDRAVMIVARNDAMSGFRPMISTVPRFDDGVYRPAQSDAGFRVVQYRPPPRIGGNSGAFHDPMTLAESFPGLRPGALEPIAVADGLLGFRQPSQEMTSALSKRRAEVLLGEIKAIDPDYRHDSFGFPQSFDGQMRALNELRRDRAAALYRIRGQTEALQVETTRFLQERTDIAYERAMRLAANGGLKPRLSTREAIGNYVDQRTRIELRALYSRLGVKTDRSQQVRVNSREYDHSGTDATYRRPDARVGKIAFDVTIAHKTLATPQIRGFFDTDFRPIYVIIIRPSQLGPRSSYIIARREK